MTWHALTEKAALLGLGTALQNGLDDSEAARRSQQFGRNELSDRGGRSPWSIIWGQLTGTLVVILILAALVSAGIGIFDLSHSGMQKGWEEVYDAIAIAVIVIMNTILGFLQEYRAERAMAALKKLSVPTVRVRRGGRVRELPATDLVPGDVVLLEAGSTVPADGRLVEAVNLRVQEAAYVSHREGRRVVLSGFAPPAGVESQPHV